jgi:DNA-binding helix-hairpin-helix protein with protein kinase domain
VKIRRRLRRIKLALGLAAGIGLCFTGEGAVIGVLVILFALGLFWNSPEELNETRQRHAVRDQRAQQVRSLQQQWEEVASESAFLSKVQALQQAKTEYEALSTMYQTERAQLHTQRRDAQLRRYLSGFFLDHARIEGIGPGRLATLASYGIETAADIDHIALAAVPGFGPKLTARLFDWRRSQELRFAVDPSKGIHPDDLSALDQRFSQKRRILEAALLRGPQELDTARRRALQQREVLRIQLARAARELQQAEADLQMM